MLIRDYLSELEQKFELIKILGYGGMGVCYLGKNRQDQKYYALKILHPDLQEDILAQQQLKQETYIEQQFQNHPHIIQTYYLIELNNLNVKVMEFMQGMTLKKYIAQPFINKIQLAEEIFTALSKALKEIHRKGICHGDIKMRNIFIEESGMIKLFDFGIAKTQQQDCSIDWMGLKEVGSKLLKSAEII